MLEGEDIVSRYMPNSPLFCYRIEPPQFHVEQIEDWKEPIHNLLNFPRGCILITTDSSDGPVSSDVAGVPGITSELNS
jgi:hypothetical protein